MERLKLDRQFPQFLKFCLMERGPLGYEASCPWWKVARQDRQAFDRDPGFELRILGVKVWRGMVATVHLDDDAVEPTDFRHSLKPIGFLETGPPSSCP